MIYLINCNYIDTRW